MDIKFDRVGDCVTVYLEGEFGLNFSDEFQDLFTSQDGNPADLEYVIDFGKVTFISSVGAGLLLRLRKHCGDSAAKISLINVGSRTLELLNVLNFDKMFDIAPAK